MTLKKWLAIAAMAAAGGLPARGQHGAGAPAGHGHGHGGSGGISGTYTGVFHSAAFGDIPATIRLRDRDGDLDGTIDTAQHGGNLNGTISGKISGGDVE